MLNKNNYIRLDLLPMKKILLILLLIPLFLNGQDFEVVHYTVEDGLMSNEIKGVFEDSLGIIWIANGLGFTRLYGDKTENITSSQRNNNSKVYSIDGMMCFNYECYKCCNKMYSRSYFYDNQISRENTSDSLIKKIDPLIDDSGYIYSRIQRKNEWYILKYKLQDTIDITKNIIDKLPQDWMSFELKLDNHNNIFLVNKDIIHHLDYLNNKVIKYEIEIGGFLNIISQDQIFYFITDFDNNPDDFQSEFRIFRQDSLVWNRQYNFYELYLNYVKTKDKIYVSVYNQLIDLSSPELVIFSSKEVILDIGASDNEIYYMTNSGIYKFENKSGKLIYPYPFSRDHNLVVTKSGLFYFEWWSSGGLYELKKKNITHIDLKTTNVKLSLPNQYFIKNGSIHFVSRTGNCFFKLDTDSIILKKDVVPNNRGFTTGTIKIANNFYFSGLYEDERSFILKVSDDLESKVVFESDEWISSLTTYDSTLYIFQDSRILIANPKSLNVIDTIYYPKKNIYNDSIDSQFYIEYIQDVLSLNNEYRKNNKEYFTYELNDTKQTYVFNYSDLSFKIIDSKHKTAALNFKDSSFFQNDTLYVYDKEKSEYYTYNNTNKNVKLNYSEIERYKSNRDQIVMLNDEGEIIIYSDAFKKIKLIGTSNNLLFSPVRDIRVDFYNGVIYGFNDRGIIEIDIEGIMNEEYSQIKKYNLGLTNGWHLESLRDSLLLIFHESGITKMNIGKFKYVPPSPLIHFTSFRQNYEPFDWTKVNASVDSSWGNVVPYNMILSHDLNHLTFDYQGVSHSNKQPLMYFHQLVGQDTSFIGTLSKSATYSNLQDGEYTFKVFAQDENGSQSKVISCSFVIKPPYWETWWFISLSLVGFAAIIYSLFQYNIRRLKARQAELEAEVNAATQEIREQKNEIEEAHREITDSIAYAKRIQGAILPPLKLVKAYLEQSFVLYKPKDVVAGDFYWMVPNDGTTYFAAADCTGHGVPGAMVSVVCNNALNRSVKEFGLIEPGEILNNTRELVIKEFEKSEEEVQDGMDIALCALKGQNLKYAGAHNPLWIVRKGEFDLVEFPEGSRITAQENSNYNLIELKADKQPIGKYAASKSFNTQNINLRKGDSIYLFSDGYVDQFGGENGKKFKSLNFKRLLLSIQELGMREQSNHIDTVFEDWRKGVEQIDDVCVIGVRV